MKSRERKLRVLLGLLALSLVCLPLEAQNARDGKPDAPKATHEIERFEDAINGAIQKSFSGPFGLVHQPKGGYVTGYGYVFNFVVNIKLGMTNTPFGLMRSGPDVTPEEKKQRIESLKDGLVRVLFDSGNGLANLQKSDSIAIMAFFEELDPLLPEGKENRTLILSVSKADLSELSNKADGYNQFKQRVKIVEY